MNLTRVARGSHYRVEFPPSLAACSLAAWREVAQPAKCRNVRSDATGMFVLPRDSTLLSRQLLRRTDLHPKHTTFCCSYQRLTVSVGPN
jgi:hypothetical protein